MNIYLISQDKNYGYDTYDSAIVVAENETQARNIIPGSEFSLDIDYWAWCEPMFVKVKLIGTTTLYKKSTIILESFNAG